MVKRSLLYGRPSQNVDGMKWENLEKSHTNLDSAHHKCSWRQRDSNSVPE